jgi:hypothetical protein
MFGVYTKHYTHDPGVLTAELRSLRIRSGLIRPDLYRGNACLALFTGATSIRGSPMHARTHIPTTGFSHSK